MLKCFRHLSQTIFFFWYRVSCGPRHPLTLCIAEDDVELWTLPPPHLRSWDYRPMTSNLDYVVLRIEPRASHILDKCSTNGATASTLPSNLNFPSFAYSPRQYLWTAHPDQWDGPAGQTWWPSSSPGSHRQGREITPESYLLASTSMLLSIRACIHTHCTHACTYTHTNSNNDYKITPNNSTLTHLPIYK